MEYARSEESENRQAMGGMGHTAEAVRNGNER
ncbi:hypothetical protein CLV84_1166 [Neolewinella xylanilytica]|uniref:Uncharacterized protein n=1 Tax=Neolewinella xylanilytica TaxID=1514080 RepID=A0A2S6I9N4_9BACT|nr:hypothetical protein CLV84_1166 [Neolewinella xylanilytica]